MIGRHRAAFIAAIVAAVIAIVAAVIASTWSTNAPTGIHLEHWVQVHSRHEPPVSAGNTLIYSSRQHKLIYFAGSTGGTWAFSNGQWFALHPKTSPGKLNFAVFSFDQSAGYGLFFGGMHGHKFRRADVGVTDRTIRAEMKNGTWIWTASGWEHRHPATSPPPAVQSSEACDQITRQCILIGGLTLEGKSLSIGTWIWNGSSWWPLSHKPYPTGLLGASLAWDGESRQIILFGGPIGLHNTTWIWSGSSWRKSKSQGGPQGLVGPPMAYDPQLKGVVLLTWTPSRKTVLWLWKADAWHRLAARFDFPQPLFPDAIIQYDQADHGLVLLGSPMSGTGGYPSRENTWILR